MFMILMGALAFGGKNKDPKDAEEIALLAEQVAAFDATIASAKAWVNDGTPAQTKAGGELVARLEAEAVELRAITKKLHILEGQARNAGNDTDLAAVEAIRSAMSTQRKERGFASQCVGAGLSLSKVQTDPAAWRQVETDYTGAARQWRGTPPDAWIVPAIEAGVASERWPFVAASAKWCSLVCTDGTAAKAALEKVPEGTGPDPRWGAALRAAETGGPAD